MWGMDRLMAGELSNTRRRLRSARVGVLTQTAAVDRRGRPTLAALEELGVTPVRIFSPEHGLDGVAQAEEPVANLELHQSLFPALEDSSEDEPSSEEEDGELQPKAEPAREVISLYGKDRASLEPRGSDLEALDVLVIDLVDVGSRYYTYVWSALLAARAAQRTGVHTLVLDRPNPISGDPALLEGTPQEPGFCSFVGLEPVPIRHCMTLGEILAHFMAAEGHALGPDGALSIVSPVGWERQRTARSWRRPFIAPSPNMPTAETALVYPGGCLLEGTNLSEGRGTTLPFQAVGAPFLDGPALARALTDAALPGVLVRPHSFRPSFDKHAGQICHGVAIHVTEERLFRPVTTYLTLIALARAQAPEDFAFRTHAYEFVEDIPAFDLLTGSSAAREAIDAGRKPEEIVQLVAPVDSAWIETVLAAEALAHKARA